MNILIAGMGRSGSTVLYNIIRELLLMNEKNVYCALDGKYSHDKEQPFNLVKTHYDIKFKDWSDIIITTKRDIRDVISSFKQYNSSYNKGGAKQWTNAFLNWYNLWEFDSDYEFIYEDFINDEEKIINDLSNLIGIKNFDMSLIKDKIISLKSNNNNNETLMTLKHISNTKGRINSYKEILSSSEINIINNIAKEWLDKHNYNGEI